jgi:alpha-L-fucosidase
MRLPRLASPLFCVSLGLALIALTVLPAVRADSAPPAETAAQKDARMKWWREARFGLFIHWGLYAVPAGTWQGRQIPGIGEWIMNKGRIPVADYEKFAGQFNPTKFDADAWVALAQAAGMKYIVITSKHHDGFAMYRSSADSYNIYEATPFHRDPLKELAAACERRGIKLGFYYSQAQDWHAPGGSAYGGHWDKAQDGDFSAYIKSKAVPQIRELLTNYGPFPAVIWFDTPKDMTQADADLIRPLLEARPDLIWNNRLGGSYLGDTETPEQRIPSEGYPGKDWETCMTINDTWGYKSYDQHWKSTEELLHNLIDIASKGGNYLLNVGPTAEGVIPEPEAVRLRAIGRWLAVNGDAIYATTAGPFKRLGWGRATQAPDRLYLHVFAWPKDGMLTVPMSSGAKSAHLLAAPGVSLRFTASPTGLRLRLPPVAPDPIASVIVLDGVGRVQALPPPPIPPAPDGSFALSCDSADLAGPNLRVEGNIDLNLTAWRSTDDVPTWAIAIAHPGDYEVVLQAQVPAGDAGSEFVLTVGDQGLAGRTLATQGEGYPETVVGRLHLGRAGPTEVSLRPRTLAGGEFMRLRAIFLRPVHPAL